MRACGVLCIYLLLGLLFGTLFGAIQSLSGGELLHQ